MRLLMTRDVMETLALGLWDRRILQIEPEG